MELTKQQIQSIEHYLNVKNITYIDVRFEILDHIVSDIEEIINTENKTFNSALEEVKQKWNPQLKETSSMYFGLGFTAPKMIIVKAKKIYTKYYLILLTSYFLPLLVLTHFDFTIQNPSEDFLFLISKIFIVLCIIAFLVMFLKKENKVETTYGFILKTQGLGLFVGLFTVLIFMTKPKELNGINIGLFCTFAFSTYSYFHFYKKHQYAIKKFKAL
ncbi:hypothetical protein [uncultured Polaribacter sp.]|uniref:hypothetical protein n=1 Tax=uncultured Polaribacter sp. TaxID=174711 RepID=UPI002639D26F|nr:hypothetical protein [uncultured Polaribacter sp.]